MYPSRGIRHTRLDVGQPRHHSSHTAERFVQDGSNDDPIEPHTGEIDPSDDEAGRVRPIVSRSSRASGTAASAAEAPGKSGKGGGRRRQGRKMGIMRVAAMVVTAIAFIGSAFVGYAYQTTNVPRPEEVKVAQYSTISYAGGEEMARVGSQNRTIVPLTSVPKHVQHAVLAAENRSFYDDPGFSPSGIARAAWVNFTQGSSQGGSTITQQYVKKTYLTDEKTLTRKFKELLIAIKLEQDYTKDEILGFYLNTIYFGRGAYGIEAASEVYFGKPVDQLTIAEGAVLASSIRSPAGYDPQNHPKAAQERWEYVLNGMQDSGWITDQERTEAAYPQVLPIGPGPLNQVNGPEGIIVTRVKEELATLGYDDDAVNSGGLRVTTTIPKAYQDKAVQAVQEQLDGEPANLVPGLVSIDPSTGAVRAYYGNAQGTGFDFAGRGYRQPGSSFKAFVLAAALENGYSLNSVRDGSSPQTFPGRTQPVRNSGGASCGACTIKQAITQSLNTTFYGLSYEMGADKVAEIAHRTGIGATRLDNGAPTLQEANGQVASAIGIGLYEVTVKDMASAFSTFAADGVYRQPYFVQQVTDANGNVLYQHEAADKQVVSHEVANDVSFGMRDVAAYSNDALADGRPTASKTGTVQLGDDNNKDAWMVGYTPQLSTAVWIGTEASEPIVTAQGRIIYGAGIPGKIWQQFMNEALDGTEIMDMPNKALIKGGKSNASTQTKTKSKTTAAPTTQDAAPTSAEPSEPAPSTETTTPVPPPTTESAPPTTTAQPPPPTTTTSAPPGSGPAKNSGLPGVPGL